MYLWGVHYVTLYNCKFTNKQYIESDQDLDNLRRCLFLKYYLYKNMYFGYLLFRRLNFFLFCIILKCFLILSIKNSKIIKMTCPQNYLYCNQYMCLLTNKQYIESDQDLDNLRRCLFLKYYLYKNMYFGYLLKFIRNSSFFIRGKTHAWPYIIVL
jgi:hypothetical protein